MKKQLGLRVISMLIVVSLCASLLPASAFAVASNLLIANAEGNALEAEMNDTPLGIDKSSVPEIIGHEEALLTCESYYTYTTPITFRLNNFVLPPFQARAVAMIHTHPYVKGLGYDEFSDPDKIYSQALNLPYYLYTATGRLLVYSPSNNDIRQICKDLEKDPHLP